MIVQELGKVRFLCLVFIVAVFRQGIQQPCTAECLIINSKVRFVLFEQGSPQAGTWDKHFAHRMAHTVFHRVVLQLIDNSRPTVHNTQHHAIGVNRVARGLNHQRQIQLILLLRCFRQVIRINYRVVYHAGFHKRIAISLRNVLYGSITILLQKIFYTCVYRREQSTPATTGQKVHLPCTLHYTRKQTEVLTGLQIVTHHLPRKSVITRSGQVIITTGQENRMPGHEEGTACG